jgi:hypothetical protein
MEIKVTTHGPADQLHGEDDGDDITDLSDEHAVGVPIPMAINKAIGA